MEFGFTHNLTATLPATRVRGGECEPDIVINVYRDDEWFMNRHRPDEMRFSKRRYFLTTAV